ncbi:MAG: efflux RND transporter periplasmic adaptor subunit [Deltaproteobacteria bacterium]|nr:efflux RND transporter periplasmic adaptor subunit [Deltaproteobacteria bacterium]
MNAKPIEAEVDVAELLARDGSKGRTRLWIKWMVLAVLAVVALAVATVVHFNSRTETVRYETQPARRGNLTVSISATGKLQPINQVSVGSELSGTIRSVEVEVNDRVKPGQVLARLDPTKLEAQFQQSKASLASSRAKVLQTQATVRESAATLDRMRRLRDLTGGKTPSQADLDGAEATLARARADEASAQAAVVQAEAVLAVNQTDLEKSVIRAPTRGVVLTRSVETGQTVAASLQAPELFLIAEDLTRMELHVNVDEADVGRVRAGQGATFTVAAYPDRKYQARLTRVHYGSTTTSGVVTYETGLRVENPDLSLRPGMTGTVEIVSQEVQDALLVPNAALRFTPDSSADTTSAGETKSGGLLSSLLPHPPARPKASGEVSSPAKDTKNGATGRVWVLRDGLPTPVPVTTGATDGRVTQVTQGDLAAGAALVVGATGQGR